MHGRFFPYCQKLFTGLKLVNDKQVRNKFIIMHLKRNAMIINNTYLIIHIHKKVLCCHCVHLYAVWNTGTNIIWLGWRVGLVVENICACGLERYVDSKCFFLLCSLYAWSYWLFDCKLLLILSIMIITYSCIFQQYNFLKVGMTLLCEFMQ